jgi:CRISPR-associated protein Csh1
MNLPQLTAKIGESQNDGGDKIFSLIKDIKTKVKTDEIAYTVQMVFDLEEKKIFFEKPTPCSQDLLRNIYYFGNNKAAALQCNIVREVDSFSYLLGAVWNDLLLALRQSGLEKTELSALLEQVKDAGLLNVGTKKGEGGVTLSCLDGLLEVQDLTFDKKYIIVNGRKDSFETFIKAYLQDKNKKNRIVLVIPAVRMSKNEKAIILSQHPDYLQLIRSLNQLDSVEANDLGEKRICYLCHKRKSDVNSNYSTKLSRSGINKIFTTTTVNSAQQISKNGYDDAYSICATCYQHLLVGEGIVEKKFKTKIAGENVFIVPEALLGDFEYEYIRKIKENTDFAFHSKDAKEWITSVEAGADYIEEGLYSLNFVIYRTDGNSVSILQTIEDVPTLRLRIIMGKISNYVEKLRTHLIGMSLGSIYRMIPVREADNKQVDIQRVLTTYKSLLSGELITKATLFSYTTEALDKGLRQLGKSRPDNFRNMDLFNYNHGKEDFFIKKIIMSYIVLFQVAQELKILDHDIFKSEGEERRMPIQTVSPGVNESIDQLESFLEEQRFVSRAKALFFLGALIQRVAIAQYLKEHKRKPILKKISYQGMNDHEIIRLYKDAVEKLHQYNKMTLFTESLMNRFHVYYGSLEMENALTEHENVFYIMSGYAYMVGAKAPDRTKEETEVQEEEENLD